MHEKSIKKRQVIYSILAIVLVLLFSAMWFQFERLHSSHGGEPVLKNGTMLPAPRDIHPFQLQSALDGRPFTNDQLKGHWTMFFFGFTHCATLCPNTLTTLGQFYDQLSNTKIKELPTVVFISIDPERDSLKQIQQFALKFNKNFKGARGTEAQIDSLANEFTILVQKDNLKKEDPDYQIEHSGSVLLINPNGQLVAVFSPPLDPSSLVQDYQAIINSDL